MFSFFATTEVPVDRMGVKGPLEFGGARFALAWTAQSGPTYRVQEYLPHGETLEAFEQMLTIHLFDVDLEVKDAVAQKLRELTTRKAADPLCNFEVTESPDGTEFMVDFLVSDSKGSEMNVVEFNVFRYKQIAYDDGKKAILVFAYCKRAYGDAITDFLRGLGDERVKHLNTMIQKEVPSVLPQPK
jgi:hypothetical protein